MPIIFQNPGLIDLRAVQVMGLHAKDTENPIGYFGTGLKYAIVVLLRNGCRVEIWRGHTQYSFHAKESDFRGKPFQQVEMEGPVQTLPLGFTLDFGKNWEPWQAIRELESNCRDESGSSRAIGEFQSQDDSTIIAVYGAAAAKAYESLDEIFLAGKPIFANKIVEVHKLSHTNTGWLYYRGVRTNRLPKPSVYCYNLKAPMRLTEDRTIDNIYLAQYRLRDGLGVCEDRDLLEPLLCERDVKNNWEHDFDWDSGAYTPSKVFCDLSLALGPRCVKSAWMAARKERGQTEYEYLQLDDFQQKMLDNAKAFITRMGEPRVNNCKIELVADLGEGILGQYKGATKTILLTLRIFEMGFKQLVSCLYEEYIHADRGYHDFDREMQNFLFDTIITQASRLQGEPI